MRARVKLLAILCLLFIAGGALAESNLKVSGGKHIGDKEPLEYEIVYTQAKGVLTIDPTGCTYYFPQWNWYWRPPCDYGPEFYRNYMVYFINSWVNYEVRLKNTGKRTYKHLQVAAIQEYNEDECYYGTCVKKGDSMPGDPRRVWNVDTLGPGQEVVLQGSYYAPRGTLPGLDQTHLVVWHGKSDQGETNGLDAPGRVLINDPEAGVYCPPEAHVAQGPT
ncbi:MAG: hypothetical protein HY558_01160 [Euryarchaeota archaeon]|nr:hypothetical protein [Euryarchaeota archaeon]